MDKNIQEQAYELYKLKEELYKSEQLNEDLNNEIKYLRNENIKLKNELNKKNNEIKGMKNIIQKNKIKEEKVNINDIMVITIVSTELNIHFSITCLPNEIFIEVEERLYKKYNNLRNTNNIFTIDNKPILRFKKICENNIHDNDILHLSILK